MKQIIKKILTFIGLYSLAKKLISPGIKLNQPTKKIFTDFYKTNGWKSKESLSGPGSTLDATRKLRVDLHNIINKYQIRSLLDIPCGDFNWMKKVVADEKNLTYVGCDIVSELIEINTQKYSSENIRFEEKNIIADPIEQFDLIICRDCLVHFSDIDIFNSLVNIKNSNSNYLLVTSFLDIESNYNIQTGQWHPIDLRKSPFNLNKPLEIFLEENTEKNRQKVLLLYKVEDL